MLKHSLKHFGRRTRMLIVQPIFVSLTVLGNATIALGALAAYYVERSTNPDFSSYFDALWWAVSTSTSVGYGDIVPITTAGRIIGMGMMLLGTALFAAFTAVFASALLAEEIEREHEQGRL